MVDFADISKEFDETNKPLFRGTASRTGRRDWSNIPICSNRREEIGAEIEHIKDVLFRFNTGKCRGVFSANQPDQGPRNSTGAEKGPGRRQKPVQPDPPAGRIRLFAASWIFTKLNCYSAKPATTWTCSISKRPSNKAPTPRNLLNIALEDVIFQFTKIGEEELVLADKLKNTLRQTREALAGNFDQQDPKFISLKGRAGAAVQEKELVGSHPGRNERQHRRTEQNP